jgi:hypothetical protein
MKIKMNLSKPKKKLAQGLLILSLALILFLAGALTARIVRRIPGQPRVLQAQNPTGVLYLSPDSGSVEANNGLDLMVNLDTGGQSVAAVDVVLEYNQDHYTVSGIDPNMSGNFKTFAPIVSAQNPSFNWQAAVNQSAGKVEFSALTFNFDPNGDGNFSDAAPTSSFNGSTGLATVHFQAKEVRRDSSSSISFTAQVNATTDSNVVMVGNEVVDILGDTHNASITVKARPVCRAAIDTSDQTVGLNDLLYILPQWGDCNNCLEDLDGNNNVGLSDLLYVTGYWNQNCPVSN